MFQFATNWVGFSPNPCSKTISTPVAELSSSSFVSTSVVQLEINNKIKK